MQNNPPLHDHHQSLSSNAMDFVPNKQNKGRQARRGGQQQQQQPHKHRQQRQQPKQTNHKQQPRHHKKKPSPVDDDHRSTTSEDSNNKNGLYKTELCRKWLQTSFCRYGDKCQFAHGVHELRATLKHPLYKTTLCKSFQATGTCRYGNRCRFIHDESEYELAHVPRGVPSQNLNVDVPINPSLTNSFSTGHLSPGMSGFQQPIPRVPSAPANMEMQHLPHTSGNGMSPLLLPHSPRQQRHASIVDAHRHQFASFENGPESFNISSDDRAFPLDAAPFSGSFSDQVLPSFCLPKAPKSGFTVKKTNATPPPQSPADATRAATAKAFGTDVLDLNANTFSAMSISQDDGGMWGTTVDSSSSHHGQESKHGSPFAGHANHHHHPVRKTPFVSVQPPSSARGGMSVIGPLSPSTTVAFKESTFSTSPSSTLSSGLYSAAYKPANVEIKQPLGLHSHSSVGQIPGVLHDQSLDEPFFAGFQDSFGTQDSFLNVC